MKVLVVGSGGREHAICRAVAKSPRVDKIYCAPGNAGIAALAECVPIGAMEFDKLVSFAKDNAIDFTIIGMDDPLVGGIVDEFEKAGLKCFGPKKNAAILEGSKAFSKDLMKKYNIPTAAYENFTDAKEALKYLETAKFPIVLKADGLALGKGVLICNTLEEAKEGVRTIMEDKKFGTAGNTMVVEEFMTGREVSVLSFVDGTLDTIDLQFEDNACVCVVLASDGYPVKYEKGFKITGFEKFDGKEDYYCYHAGTKFDDDGNIVTNGGRVLGITATGATLKEARAKAYEATEWVQFDNKYMRHDIGKAIDEA